MTRGMKKALTHKACTPANSAFTAKRAKRKIAKRIHPMCTRNSTSQLLTDTIDEMEDDDDIPSFVHPIYCAENEILRLSNLTNSLSLKLQNALETHNDLTARLNRLEALLPPPPPGHPLPVKTEPTDDINTDIPVQ